MIKSTYREIRSSLGRYIAIMLIVMLGVGFFAGLKVTRDAMVATGEKYLNNQSMYDFKLVSTIGFDTDAYKTLNDMKDVTASEGSKSADIIMTNSGGSDMVLKTISMPDNINIPELLSGKMPSKSNECLADSRKFSSSDIGKTISISSANSDSDSQKFSVTEFTITGIVRSPLYIRYDRGTTALGNGTLNGFIYILNDAYAIDYDTEIYVKLKNHGSLYSDEYNDYIDDKYDAVNEKAIEIAASRYSRLAMYGISEPSVYTLTRSSNSGYANFENDSAIVMGIANVFPIFFFLVAALVCMTTMTRMMEEHRTQVGVLKALGYSNTAIIGKYLFYSGSASLIGGIIGYFLGTIAFPSVIWIAYGMMYNMGSIVYVTNIPIALISVSVAFLCAAGTTFFCCYRELNEMAASLMRPKAPTAGKRIILEKISFIWKRMKFLDKVSARNLFRYKKRVFMMVIGISGCTALLVTGFGLKDSIADVANDQFNNIFKYDLTVNVKDSNAIEDAFNSSEISTYIDAYMASSYQSMDMSFKNKTKSIEVLTISDDKNLSKFIDLHDTSDKKIAFPKKGEAVITKKYAEIFNLKKGDTFSIKGSNMSGGELTVSAICENYFDNYIMINSETYLSLLGHDAVVNHYFININKKADSHAVSALLMKEDCVTSVLASNDLKDTVSDMMKSLNYVVALVIFCAALLAFIVIYNLNNINITERIREIATIKVLGFYKEETKSYVFRENIILTLFGSLVGLILGHFLHEFVMSQINIDSISFNVHVKALSYLLSVIMTFLFNSVISILMTRKLENINMAESLKSID